MILCGCDCKVVRFQSVYAMCAYHQYSHTMVCELDFWQCNKDCIRLRKLVFLGYSIRNCLIQYIYITE